MGTASADPALARLDAVLARAGWNLRGALPIAAWDAIVPEPFRAARRLPDARSALVLGSGGRALWDAFRASPERGAGPDPLDAMTARVAREAAAALASEGASVVAVLAHAPVDGAFADFVALGHAAGLGAPSRLGLLLHPEYGPWISLRAALLCTQRLPAAGPLVGFAPCEGCPAPCASACHGAAVATGGFRIDRCAAARGREPACGSRCDARRACVLGTGHAYAPEAESHHMRRGGVPPAGAPGSRPLA